MNTSIIPQLIRKDIELHKNTVLGAMAGGAASILLILFSGGGVFGLVGIVSFFIALIVLSSMLPGQCLSSERKNQTLSFLMSLPVSALQYTIAKFVSAFLLFLVPWLTMTAVGTWIVLASPETPHGVLPLFLALCMLVMVGMFVMSGVALVAESEGWVMGATVFVNISYNFAWIFIANNSSIRADLKSPTPVWNTAVRSLIGGEIAVIAIILGLTFYLQSRKRDFI